MPLARVRHWATRAFHSFLVDRAQRPFEWGVHDCALFAADGVHAITGTDIATDFRGKYSDQAGAWAAIKSIAGGTTVADAAEYCATKHGLEQLRYPLMAQRGDLVVYRDPATDDLVSGLIHLNGRHIVAAGPEGLKKISISNVLRAWHV